MNATVTEGQTASFSVTATGSGPLSYQWLRNGTAVPGATTSTYAFSAALTDNGAAYSAQVSNNAGSATSNLAVLTVLPLHPNAPAITSQPDSQSSTEGATIQFRVSASGTPPLAYQWLRNGQAVANGTSDTCRLSPVLLSDQGAIYTVDVTNTYGMVTSSPVRLAVMPKPGLLTATSTSLQAGESTTLTITFDGPLPQRPAAYILQPGDSILSNSGQTLTVTPLQTTVYTFTYNDSADFTYNMAALPVVVGGVPAAFTSSGNLIVPREGSAAAALTGERILVCGGKESAARSTAEIYSATTSISSFTTVPMTAGRVYHTATGLKNGKVLIAGGLLGTQSQNGAELFEPATGSFTTVPGGMAVPRAHHTATLLADGKVLLAGGLYSGQVLAGAEVYDPDANAFTSLPVGMTTARMGHSAILLANGKVLLCGGMSNLAEGSGVSDAVTGIRGTLLASGELFDPSTGGFTGTANTMRVPRLRFSACPSLHGWVAMIGGQGSRGNSLPSAGYTPMFTGGIEYFDPGTSGFTETGSSAYAFDGDAMTTGIGLADGRILALGGSATNGVVDTPYSVPRAFLLDPAMDTVESCGPMAMNQFAFPAFQLTSGKVLILGGARTDSRVMGAPRSVSVGLVEVFDPSSQGAAQVTVAPSVDACYAGAIRTYHATVANAWGNQAVTWSVVEANGGTIQADPADPSTVHYTAPATAGTRHVVATSQLDPASMGVATVTVYLPGTIAVAVSPDHATVPANGTQTFTAIVQNALNPAVTWSVQEPNGGVVSAAGVYAAPSAPGTYHVKATSVEDPTRFATAVVTVS